jgi:hypothetical protein
MALPNRIFGLQRSIPQNPVDKLLKGLPRGDQALARPTRAQLGTGSARLRGRRIRNYHFPRPARPVVGLHSQLKPSRTLRAFEKMVDRVTRPGWGIQDFLEWACAADQFESIPEHQFVQLTNQGAVFVTRVDSESLGESVAAFTHYLAHTFP